MVLKSVRQDTIYCESYSDNELALRKFDMNPAYGPSTGVSRKERWTRAKKLDCNPPQFIMDILSSDKTVEQSSMWNNIRV